MTNEEIPKKTVCCPGPHILTHTSEALTPGHHHHVSRTRGSISKDGFLSIGHHCRNDNTEV